jgi:hypothetical protein
LIAAPVIRRELIGATGCHVDKILQLSSRSIQPIERYRLFS